jgi:uncharacterized membrane protein
MPRMFRSDRPRTFLSETERRLIVDAIKAAEAKTSAEIRVHLDRRAKGDTVAAARREFDLLGMSHTQDRNGVLIYLAVRDRAFALVGDVGLNGKVDAGFWDGLKEKLAQSFKADRFGDGIATIVGDLGGKLGALFPHREGQANQLPDDVSVGRDE